MVKKLLYGVCLLFACMMIACGPDFEDMVLYPGDKEQLPDTDDYVAWTSDNENIAYVEGSYVVGQLVGTTMIRSEEGEFQVTVKPTISLYDEPCLEWGASKKVVKGTMGAYKLNDEDSDYLLYDGKDDEEYIYYSFENGGLDCSQVMIPDYVDSEKLVDFLLERYVFITYDEEDIWFYFNSADGNSFLGLTYSGEYWTVVYIPNSRSSINIKDAAAKFNIKPTNSDKIKQLKGLLTM